MSGLFRHEPAAAASAPLAIGPEAGAAEIAGASLDAEAIRTDAWNLMGRRKGERLRQVYEAAYPEEERRQARIEARLSPDDIRLMEAGGTNERIEAFVSQMFSRIEQLNEQGSGNYANLPKSMAEIEDAVGKEVLEEYFAAERVLARGQGGFLGQTVPEFAGGAVGGLSAPDVPLAFLGGSGTLARRMLIEAGLGAGGEAATLPRQMQQSEELGLPEPSPTLQVGAGAAFAAGLPVAGRAIAAGGGLGVRVTRRALLSDARARASKFNPEKRAALDQVEKEQQTADANPGIGQAEFEVADRQAETALRAGGGPEAMPDTGQPAEAVRPKIRAAPRGDQTASRIIQIESGGRTDARPRDPETGEVLSSALGPGGFIEDTWLTLVERYRPDVMEGRTREQVLALREDPDLSREMVERNVDEARAFLGRHDLPIHDGAVYLYHFAGDTGARRILEAEPETPIGKLMSRKAIDVNTRLGVEYNGKRFSEFTAQDLRDWARAKQGLATGNIDDYPVASEVFDFDPMTLRTDAETFQYKAGGDEHGVTDRLGGERVWDRHAATGVLVYETSFGQRFIADGHQRLGLARRFIQEGAAAADGKPITLQGHLYREVDGWTPEMVRLKAAEKNMRQESGSALDAAKIIRDFPELRGTLNVGRTFLAQADALGRLTPENFQAVVNDVIDQRFGAVVGRVMPGDADLQAAAVQVLARARPENITQAEAMVRQVRRMGLEARESGAQGSLFGERLEGRESAVLARGQVLDDTLKELRRDQKLFARINRERGTLEETGNEIAQTENERRAAENARAVESILILADEPGPIRDLVDNAARAVARGGSRRKAVAELVKSVREAVERGDLERVVGRDDPARVPDPDRAGRRATARDIEAEEAGDRVEADAAPIPPERFADPVNGAGARDEAEVLEAELEQALGGEFGQLGVPIPLDEDGLTINPRQLRQDLADDAEFQTSLDLCPPGRATA